MSGGEARRLPPLNALRIFDTVSRLGSLTRAAEVLSITQSAVSRQIAVLEDHLGRPLFERERYGVRLSEAGAAYALEIAPALASIEAASRRMLEAVQVRPLHLRCYNVVAVKWLIPRLPRFQRAHPRIEVRVSQGSGLADFDGEEFDLAIQFGDGRWPRLNRRVLIPDMIQPVCSPRLLREHPALRSAGGLRHVRILHTGLRPDDWPSWLAAFGARDLPVNSMEFPSLLMTYQAAAEGLGVAMGQLTLLEQDLARGTLVRLFETHLCRPLAYYIVWPKGRRRSTRLQTFVDWLMSEAPSG
jgi:LysR family glycine cleavage system transcriptional activator